MRVPLSCYESIVAGDGIALRAMMIPEWIVRECHVLSIAQRSPILEWVVVLVESEGLTFYRSGILFAWSG
jgi:hypothetical protein